MGDLTRDIPKPLIPVAGKPLIDHALELCGGFQVRVVNTHYKPDMLEAHLANRNVAISREEDLLDTGGGLKAALPLLPGSPVATLNSDAVWSGANPLTMLGASWDPGRMDVLLALVPLERAIGRKGGGDFSIGVDGRLTRGGDFVYTGAQFLVPGVVAEVAERVFSLNRVWDAAAARGRLFGVEWPGTWADVGHPAGLAAAKTLLEDANRA